MIELAMAALFSIITSSVYAYVGREIVARPVSEKVRLASVLFGTWWFGLAGIGYISAMLNLAAAAGFTNLELWLTLGLFNLLVLCVALWALLFYLVYLYTGSRAALVPLSLFYLVVYLVFMYLINLNTPVGVEVGRWTAAVKYETEFDDSVGQVAIVLLLGPQLLAAIAYFSLIFKATDRTQRFRIAMVSLAIIVWFGSSTIVGFSGQAQSDVWQVASRVISLLATFAILFAYKPPQAWREKYGLRGVNEPIPEHEVRNAANRAG